MQGASEQRRAVVEQLVDIADAKSDGAPSALSRRTCLLVTTTLTNCSKTYGRIAKQRFDEYFPEAEDVSLYLRYMRKHEITSLRAVKQTSFADGLRFTFEQVDNPWPLVAWKSDASTNILLALSTFPHCGH